MNIILQQVCAGLLSLSGAMAGDACKSFAPSAYQHIETGTAYAEVERLLGPAEHGHISVGFSLSYTCGEGLEECRAWIGGEGVWETDFGIVTVKYVGGQVTEKSFKLNSSGVTALCGRLPMLLNLHMSLPPLRIPHMLPPGG